MVSLKLSPKEQKAETIEAKEGDAPLYPYGMSLYIEDETLKKLGLTADIKPGTIVTLTGKAEITGYSMNSYAGGEHQSLSMQLTDLDIVAPDEEKSEGEKPSLATKMYANPPKSTPYGT